MSNRPGFFPPSGVANTAGNKVWDQPGTVAVAGYDGVWSSDQDRCFVYRGLRRRVRLWGRGGRYPVKSRSSSFRGRINRVDPFRKCHHRWGDDGAGDGFETVLSRGGDGGVNAKRFSRGRTDQTIAQTGEEWRCCQVVESRFMGPGKKKNGSGVSPSGKTSVDVQVTSNDTVVRGTPTTNSFPPRRDPISVVCEPTSDDRPPGQRRQLTETTFPTAYRLPSSACSRIKRSS